MKKSRINIFSTIISVFMMLAIQQPVQAGMVSTPQLLQQSMPNTEIIQIRSDLLQQLVTLGVEPQQAVIRVDSMTDAQISEIHHKMNELPAGADLGGTLLTIFIVFVITDVIGATDIFPFIHPVR